jgi:hypothetical protein
MARRAIHQNVSRVLARVKDKAEHVSPFPSRTTIAD